MSDGIPLGYVVAAFALGLGSEGVIGTMERTKELHDACERLGTDVVPAGLVDHFVGAGAVEALARGRLVERLEDGNVRVVGVRRLRMHQQRRAAAPHGGRKRAALAALEGRDAKGRFKPSRNTSRTATRSVSTALAEFRKTSTSSDED